MVKHLFETMKFDVQLRDEDGSTPLHYACQNLYVDVIEYLIEELGADLVSISSMIMMSNSRKLDRSNFPIWELKVKTSAKIVLIFAHILAYNRFNGDNKITEA